MADIVIDLSSRPIEDELTVPVRRRWRWSGWRDLTLGLVALITLLSATTAGPQDKPFIVRLGLIEGSATSGPVGLSQGTVFHFSKGGLAANSLAGTPLWWTGLGMTVVSSIRPARGLVIVTGHASTATSNEEISVVLDMATGREVGRTTGSSLRAAGDHLVEHERFAPRSSRIRRADTFEVVWEVEAGVVLGAVPSPVRPGDPWLIYTIDPGGTLHERELPTGKVIRSRKAPYPGPLGSFAVDNDLVRIFPDNRSTQPMLIDRATFAESDRELVSSKWDCGPVACLSTGNNGLVVMDPATGAELWRTPAGIPATTSLGLLFENQAGSSLADFQTGGRISFPGWRPIGSGKKVQLMSRIGSAAGLTEVGVLTPDGVQPIGRLPFALGTCQADDGILVCRTTDQKIGMWQIEWPGERDDHRSGPPGSW